MAKEAVEMLDADALAVHLNVLQELVQPGGDKDFRGVADAIRRVTESLKVPVIVKEVGCGISYEDAVVLKEAGVRAIDVSGSGGTNWTEIERQRALAAGDLDKASLAEVFREWGIPTAAAVMEVLRVEGVEVVGSGGIRTGLEVAKVLALGASMAGMARPFLSAAVEGPEAVMRLASRIERELRAAMVLTGSRRIADLRSASRVILGPLKDWCVQRGVLR
jgi:isopentenyl-diphosphate delta-isomerase